MNSGTLSNMLRPALLLSLLAIFGAGTQATAAVPSGSGLDQTFGDRGVALFRGVAGRNTAVEICKPAANGRLLVGGIGSNRMLGDGFDPGGGNAWIGWLTSSGKPVRRFGRNGVLTKMPVRGARLRAVTPDNNGRTLAIIGRRTGKRTYASLIRLTTSGKLDRTFGTGGRVALGRIASNTFITLLPGSAHLFVLVERGDHGALKRFSPDGELDRSFAGGSFTPSGFVLTNATPMPDGTVFVMGRQPVDAETSRAVIQRLRVDGSIDTTWGTAGSHIVGSTPDSVALDLNPTAPPADLSKNFKSVYVSAVAPLADGRLGIRLRSSTTTGYGYPVWSQVLLANGQLDTNFGTAGSRGVAYGMIVFDGGGGDYTWSWDQFAPDGRIYYGYYGELDGKPSFGFSRLDASGAPDKTFAPELNLGRSRSWVQDVRLDAANGRVISCGFTSRSRPYRADGYVFAVRTR